MLPPPLMVPPRPQNHVITTADPDSQKSWPSPGSIGNGDCLEDLAPEASRTPSGRHKTLSRDLQEASRGLKSAPRGFKSAPRSLQEHSEASRAAPGTGTSIEIIQKTMKIDDFHEIHCWVFKCCQKGPRSSPGALQKPLGRTMGLQDSDKSSPRDHQESLEGLQERSKSSPEAAKSAPEGLKRPP